MICSCELSIICNTVTMQYIWLQIKCISKCRNQGNKDMQNICQSKTNQNPWMTLGSSCIAMQISRFTVTCKYENWEARRKRSSHPRREPWPPGEATGMPLCLQWAWWMPTYCVTMMPDWDKAQDSVNHDYLQGILRHMRYGRTGLKKLM